MKEHGGDWRHEKRRLAPPLFPRKNLLNTEVGEDLRFGFIHGKQVVAGRAILRDGLAIFCAVLAIVAAETTGIAHVTDVIGMSTPRDLHFGEHIGRED